MKGLGNLAYPECYPEYASGPVLPSDESPATDPPTPLGKDEPSNPGLPENPNKIVPLSPPVAPAPAAKAISIRQPWAWAIFHLDKNIENRTWNTHYRGELYIHVPKKYDRRGAKWIEQKFGIIPPGPDELPMGAIVGRVKLVDCSRNSKSPWAMPDCHHFELKGATSLSSPIPCKGQLGLFPVDLTLPAASVPFDPEPDDEEIPFWWKPAPSHLQFTPVQIQRILQNDLISKDRESHKVEFVESPRKLFHSINEKIVDYLREASDVTYEGKCSTVSNRFRWSCPSFHFKKHINAIREIINQNLSPVYFGPTISPGEASELDWRAAGYAMAKSCSGWVNVKRVLNLGNGCTWQVARWRKGASGWVLSVSRLLETESHLSCGCNNFLKTGRCMHVKLISEFKQWEKTQGRKERECHEAIERQKELADINFRRKYLLDLFRDECFQIASDVGWHLYKQPLGDLSLKCLEVIHMEVNRIQNTIDILVNEDCSPDSAYRQVFAAFKRNVKR